MVEQAVRIEAGFAAEARPGLAAMAFQLAALMDNPRATNQWPAASKVLANLLDQLQKVNAPKRRSHLALVKEMTSKGGA